MRTPFDQAVRAHGPTVLLVARAAVGPDDADDVWSEAFLAALRAWPQLDADTNVQAWLVTITHRKAIDHLRARSRRPAVEVPEELGIRGADAAERLDVVAAVAELPERQRVAVAYHHLTGMPWADVARVLDCTPAAARKAGSDGIRALRTSTRLSPGEAR